MTQPRVIISNVAKNNAYPIVETLEDAGWLEKFITAVYYKPTTLEGRLVQRAARLVGKKDATRVTRRRIDGVPDEKVVSIPLPEIGEQALARAAQKLGFDPRPATYVKCEVFDGLAARHVTPCTVFHGFEQCALFSLKKAKQRGAITILDQPQMHRSVVDRLEREERARLGMAMPTSRPFWFEQHVRRKYREHELTDYVFAPLEFVKRTLMENGFAAERIFVLPYGVDVSDYKPVERPASRERFEILYVGPLHYWKGLQYLLDAMARVDIPSARLTIIGSVEPDWRDYFLRRIGELGDKARYLEPVPNSEIKRLYAEADVLAFPSMIGGVGIVCYEAMATGLPLITSEPDVVLREGVDCLCANPRDVDAWCAALERLARDPALRRRIGDAGIDRVKVFTTDAYRKGVRDAYEQILARERVAEKSAVA